MYTLKLETVQEMILTFLWSMRTVKFKNGWGVVELVFELDERGEAAANMSPGCNTFAPDTYC